MKTKITYSLPDLLWTIETPMLIEIGEKQVEKWITIAWVEDLEALSLCFKDIKKYLKDMKKRKMV